MASATDEENLINVSFRTGETTIRRRIDILKPFGQIKREVRDDAYACVIHRLVTTSKRIPSDEDLECSSVINVLWFWIIQEFRREIEEGKSIRLIYQGRLLDDNMRPVEYVIPSDATIHCVITNRVNNNDGNSDGGDQYDWEAPSWVLWLVCGLALSFFWLLFLAYGTQFVSGTALVLLCMLTSALVFFFWLTYRTSTIFAFLPRWFPVLREGN